jgi:hypothetical protein
MVACADCILFVCSSVKCGRLCVNEPRTYTFLDLVCRAFFTVSQEQEPRIANV